MNYQINHAGLEIIKTGESLRLKTYLDPVGIPTIGWGHTGHDVHMGQTITRDQAEMLLRADIAHAATAVSAATHSVPTTGNEFSAMVSLAFNIGVGAFRGSTVLRMHRAENKQAAADAFLRWNKAHKDGALIVLPGLTKRREQERALYLEPD